MSSASQQSLLASLRALQISHEYSDLKIFCGDEVLPVHKAIICPRSKVFDKSCKWGGDISLKEEITLQDEDPRLIKLMIDFMYQLDYDDLPPSNAPSKEDKALPPDSPVARSIQHYEKLGKSGNMDLLPEPEAEQVLEPQPDLSQDSWPSSPLASKRKKKGAKGKKKCSLPLSEDEPPFSHGGPESNGQSSTSIVQQVRDDEEDVDLTRLTTNAMMYALADKFDVEDLKQLAKEKFGLAVQQDWKSKAFARAAELVFENPNPDKGLRNIVIHTLNKHRELVNYDDIQKLLASGNGMAYAFVLVLLKETPGKEPDQPNWW